MLHNNIVPCLFHLYSNVQRLNKKMFVDLKKIFFIDNKLKFLFPSEFKVQWNKEMTSCYLGLIIFFS